MKKTIMTVEKLIDVLRTTMPQGAIVLTMDTRTRVESFVTSVERLPDMHGDVTLILGETD